MKKLVLILMAVASLGCTGRRGTENKVIVPPDSGMVEMPLKEGSGEATIRKTERKSVIVELSADGFTHLHALITPVEPAEGNVRINTITLPDGSTDGPWGQSIDYDIPSDGKIRLEIGESLMQGDPWGGDFKIEVKLTK